MDVLLLRFDAPMMSFGGPMYDAYGVQRDWPGLGMVTGLLGNALGLHHRDFEQLQSLQDRLHVATRRDRRGSALRDYQTVDLGRPHLVRTGWTTRGVEQERAGGDKTRTLQRYQDYKADALYTLAITLDPANEVPTLHDMAVALRRPARPLFLGRKCCLPAAPLLLGRATAPDLRTALAEAPLPSGCDGGPHLASWPDDGADVGRLLRLSDGRDWANQIHAGERRLREGTLPQGGGQ